MTPVNVPFEQIIQSLLDENTPFPPVYLHRFSNLNNLDFQNLRKVWKQIKSERRATLFQDLIDLAESDTLLDFDRLSFFALGDDNPAVRTYAIQLLWEYERPDLIQKLAALLEKEKDENVRAAVASNLGHFVLLGELEDIPSEAAEETYGILKKLFLSDPSTLVRRTALESLGFSDQQEVRTWITAAYKHTENEWKASALFAMGRSANESWSKTVLKAMDYPSDIVRLEAVRAAGELGLAEARQPLIEMSKQGVEDDDVRAAVIWSLSQIGGEDVKETLEALLEDAADDEETDYIEEAIENLSFTEDISAFEFLDLNEVDPEELDTFIDLEEEKNQKKDPLAKPVRKKKA